MEQQIRLSRRGFVGAAAGAAAASAVTWVPGASAHRRHRHGHDHGRGDELVPRDLIGIQLFTLRRTIREQGFEPVFAQLQEFGYSEVEFAGYGDLTDEQLRDLLRRYDLRAVGSHVGYGDFLEDLEGVLDRAEAIGMPYIGTASSPAGQGNGQTPDGYRQAAEDFNRFGAAARERGLKFYQHNHSSEFEVVDGVRLYDVLLENTDPELVFFELDIFWAYVGQSLFPGFRPHDYPWYMPERFPLFHVKDGIMDGGEADGWTMTDVGDGDLPFEPFFCGLDRDEHHYIVERDSLSPDGELSTAERSIDYLHGLEERECKNDGRGRGHDDHDHHHGRGPDRDSDSD